MTLPKVGEIVTRTTECSGEEPIHFDEPPPGYPSNVCVFEPLSDPVVGQYVYINMLIVGPVFAKVSKVEGDKAYAESLGGKMGFLLNKQPNGHWWCQTSINLACVQKGN